MPRPHYQLKVWQVSMGVVRDVYRLTATFPADERFGLTAQLRRAAVSVPSNIAEGAARAGKREFARYLIMARGSLAEVDTQLQIASDLEFADTRELLLKIESLFGLIGGLVQKLRLETDSSQAAQPPTGKPRSG